MKNKLDSNLVLCKEWITFNCYYANNAQAIQIQPGKFIYIFNSTIHQFTITNIFFCLYNCRARGKIKNDLQHYGLQYDQCEYFYEQSIKQFMKNKRHIIMQKYSLFSMIKSLCDGLEVFNPNKKE